MNIRMVGVILGKDLIRGPKNFLFIWAIVAPLLISLVFSFAMGGFLSDQPNLGVLVEGKGKMLEYLEESEGVNLREYESLDNLRRSVERGSLDMGVVLPEDITGNLSTDNSLELRSFVWGSSPASNRTILKTFLIDGLQRTLGDEPPLEVEFVTLGEREFRPWKERFLPFLVLMAVFLGGAFLPAGGLIEEKERGTLTALITSPATIWEIMLAKAIVGVGVSLFVAVVILLLNGAFGTQPFFLLLSLGLGGVMASEIGLISGILLKDITSLLALWKAGGIFLFAPGFVYLFPAIPRWIGKIIPTYYYISPVVKITQEGRGWGAISSSIYILLVIILALIFLIYLVVNRAEGRFG